MDVGDAGVGGDVGAVGDAGGEAGIGEGTPVDGGSSPEVESGGPSESTKAPPAQRYKFKRGGREYDSTAEEMIKMLGDDHEEEFSWKSGGKDHSIKANRQTLLRALQKEGGALGKMQQYQEAIQRIQQQEEYGRKNPGEFFAGRLGLDKYESKHPAQDGTRMSGYDAWILDQAQELYLRQQELADLQGSNPMLAAQKMQERAEANFKRHQAMRQHEAQLADQRRQAQAAQETRQNELKGAFAENKTPYNALTEAIARGIVQEYAQADAIDMLTPAALADLTRKAMMKHSLEVFDSHEGEGVLGYLGDGRRKALRELELAAAQEQRKTARREQREAARPSNGAPKPPSERRYVRGKGVGLV